MRRLPSPMLRLLALALIIALPACDRPAPRALPAPAVAASTPVYVTATGTKYHRGHCRYLKTRVEITLERAREAYQPCKVCQPPR